ncbi:head GIN domain-containing protein [Zhouia sp. PK063]|uniref:head GIN domain-containing protein n=1 Tax=Zhouia sp. PK063 TaxID=3373602 RepID=UPI003796AFBD
MKKITLTVLLTVLLTSVSHAQWWGSNKTIKGNGNSIEDTRSTKDYDGVHVAGAMDVTLVAGNEGKITVKTDDNLQEYIVTEVENNTLKIYVKKGYNVSTRKGIIVTVPVETIDEVALAGSGDVATSGITLKSNKITVRIAGSGDLDLAVDAKEVEGKLAGSGDLKLKGTTTTFDCSLAGSGDVYAADLKATDVSVSVAGSGDARVYCDGNLNAKVVGSGDIYYKGNPKHENSKVAGSGDISKL